MATKLKARIDADKVDVPDHIPGDLVSPLDFYRDPAMKVDPFARVAALQDGPRVVWNPVSARYGHGAWLVTHAEDIRHVLSNPQIFSSEDWTGHNLLTGGSWKQIPLELDGERHRKFRMLMNPWFTPAVVARMGEKVRARAAELVERVADKGECDFIAAFAKPFPISIFLELMGFPLERVETFLAWEYEMLHTTNHDRRAAISQAIIDYLWSEAEDRRVNPRDDLTTRISQAQVDGRPLTYEETIGMLYTLFIGGLDTVVSSLGFHFRHLASDAALQERLRSQPEKIDRAVDELLRRFSPVNTRRRATCDTEVAGVKIAKGEWIAISYALGSLDPRDFAEPMTVDIDRKSVRHLAFAFGPHFCLGAHLAKRELTVAIAEWLRRIPTFRIRQDVPVGTHGGGVFGVDNLPLVWTPAAPAS